jgi:hypothetical protein
MKILNWTILLGISAMIFGCGGPAHPTEEEVKQQVVGSYCAENANYRVDLNPDGRYEARRAQRGALATGRFAEKCEGNYSFEYDEDKHLWNLVFQKADKHSNPFIRCEARTVVVWEHEKGYTKSGDFLVISEPFDQEQLIKDCGIQ